MTEQATSIPQRTKTSPVLVILAVVILAAVLASLFLSVRTEQSVQRIMEETGAGGGVTQEDDVKIMGEYWIRSTLPISDAYKSGDDSKLSEREKDILGLAASALEEIFPDGTEDLSNYEKELAVYQWMTKELSYDAGVLQVIPQTEADADNPYGTLKYHNAVCVGYATTFRLFMQMMDIPCMVVHNTDAYHSWDLVQLDDQWYHVDIYSDQSSGNYANFNMNDEMCAQGHDWDRDFFPVADGIQYNYAAQNAQPAEDIYAIPAQIKDALDQQEGSLFLDFPVIDEDHAQIVETMLGGVQSCLNESEDYMALWMNWSWLRISGNEYVLAIYIDGYEDDGGLSDLPEEEQEKISQAIEDAFGAAPDWDEMDGMGDEWAEEASAEAVG